MYRKEDVSVMLVFIIVKNISMFRVFYSGFRSFLYKINIVMFVRVF